MMSRGQVSGLGHSDVEGQIREAQVWLMKRVHHTGRPAGRPANRPPTITMTSSAPRHPRSPRTMSCWDDAGVQSCRIPTGTRDRPKTRPCSPPPLAMSTGIGATGHDGALVWVPTDADRAGASYWCHAGGVVRWVTIQGASNITR